MWPHMYSCTECGGYCVCDPVVGDFICTECGLCTQDVSVGWQEVGLPFDCSSTQSKTVYEPVKYLQKKLHQLKLTSSQQEEVIKGFKRVSSVYQELKGTRKSNLHYFYVIKKLLELMECWEESERVPPVKGWKKLMELDAVWVRICEKLEFYFWGSI